MHAQGCPSFWLKYGVCSCGAYNKLDGPAGEPSVPLRSMDAEKSRAETQPSRSAESTGAFLPDDVGLSIDMLDVDRLRDWARLLLDNGSDVSRWASVPHLASRMQTLATNIEKTVRDIGAMRQQIARGDETSS